MLVAITAESWVQQTPKGRVWRSRGEEVDLPDGVAEWLISLGSARLIERNAKAATAAAEAANAAAEAASVDGVAEKAATKPARRGRRQKSDR